ncbi:hypothetical protein EBZ35_06130 [bacterium]|nr:hypothetical protein [bacterium]
MTSSALSPLHHRRSIRLKHDDYSQTGAYFITICTHNRDYLFGDVVDGVMVWHEWQHLVDIVDRVGLDKWVYPILCPQQWIMHWASIRHDQSGAADHQALEPPANGFAIAGTSPLESPPNPAVGPASHPDHAIHRQAVAARPADTTHTCHQCGTSQVTPLSETVPMS